MGWAEEEKVDAAREMLLSSRLHDARGGCMRPPMSMKGF